MKKTVVAAALLIAIAFSAFAQKQDGAKPDEKIVQSLRQFESDWLTASLNQDKAWLERFFAGKFLVIPFESDALKNRTRETIEMIDPELKPEEMKVRITGNVTVLTNAGNRSYYFLDTFNRRGGKWQIIAAHFSRAFEPNNENAEQVVLRIEREFRNATVKKDFAELERIIADDFVGAESSGRIVDKISFINGAEFGDAAAPEDIKIRIYGETAIVTGLVSVKAKTKKADSDRRLLFTDVWTRRGDRWQIVNSQTTQIK